MMRLVSLVVFAALLVSSNGAEREEAGYIEQVTEQVTDSALRNELQKGSSAMHRRRWLTGTSRKLRDGGPEDTLTNDYATTAQNRFLRDLRNSELPPMIRETVRLGDERGTDGRLACSYCQAMFRSKEKQSDAFELTLSHQTATFIKKGCIETGDVNENSCLAFGEEYYPILETGLRNEKMTGEVFCNGVQFCGVENVPAANYFLSGICERCQELVASIVASFVKSPFADPMMQIESLCAALSVFSDQEKCIKGLTRQFFWSATVLRRFRISPKALCRVYGPCMTFARTRTIPWTPLSSPATTPRPCEKEPCTVPSPEGTTLGEVEPAAIGPEPDEPSSPPVVSSPSVAPKLSETAGSATEAKEPAPPETKPTEKAESAPGQDVEPPESPAEVKAPPPAAAPAGDVKEPPVVSPTESAPPESPETKAIESTMSPSQPAAIEPAPSSEIEKPATAPPGPQEKSISAPESPSSPETKPTTPGVPEKFAEFTFGSGFGFGEEPTDPSKTKTVIAGPAEHEDPDHSKLHEFTEEFSTEARARLKKPPGFAAPAPESQPGDNKKQASV